MELRQGDVTQALLAAGGDEAAAGRLWTLVYEGLRRLAHRALRDERPGHTLNTTALVHEAYLRLVDETQVSYADRAHFYGLACRAMRRILVDHARRRRAQKRGSGHQPVPFDEAFVVVGGRGADLVALDEALDDLAARDARLGQVVECRFFGGLSAEETAAVLGTSLRTVERDWHRARTYLHRALRTAPGEAPLGEPPAGGPTPGGTP